MSRLDTLIRGAQVVDGTGAASLRADVGLEGGRIVAVGTVDDAADKVIDADGLVVAPGFVDPHTHYDAQLFWDSLASPSSWHGVTSVIGGNCGFTLAPLLDRDADYTRKMMAQVEGMPLAALEHGVPWDWESFGGYLDGLEGQIAINAGFMVGHCALRRFVLGEDFARPATPDEVDAITSLLGASLASGGIGLSTTRSPTHVDGDGDPVPSRWADPEEVLRLCVEVSKYPGTSLEMINQGCISRFSEEDVDLLAEMSATANRPLNWNVLSVAAKEEDRVRHQLAASAEARRRGGRVVALSMPVFADNNMSFLTYCAMWLIPGWRDVLDVPVADKIRALRDPEVRARMSDQAAASPMGRFAEFDRYLIGDVFSEQNRRYQNRIVGEIAAERGEDPFTTIVDIVTADELRTVLWPIPANDSDEDWALRRHVWDEPDVLLGGSDAGAHLDRMLGSPYPTKFLGDCLRGRRLVSLELAVHKMTDVPARLFGLRGRGRVAPGYQGDLVLFDPETVDAAATYTAYDLPGGSKRLLAKPVGVERVLVNGIEILTNGEPTGAIPGTVLRSGRDTHETAIRA